MTITQQYALDLFRATQHGVTPPPVPGTTSGGGPGPLRRAVRALRTRRAARRAVRRAARCPVKPTGCATC